ncbi:hypothetical protein Hdeb2414_s0006g00204421 [Helianthus debilis subsp. tardiflorus]
MVELYLSLSFRCAFIYCGLTILLPTTSRYSPTGPTGDTRGNRGVTGNMPPIIFRGKGRGRRGIGEIVTHNDHEAGPSKTRAPSTTRSEEPQRRRNLFEPAWHSTSHSSTPSYRHSFGPDSENNPNNPQPSYIPLQRSVSHRYFDDPTPYFRGQFNPADYIQEPAGFVPLGPQDHFSEDHMDEDTDPIEPARGTPTHPIEISDGSSYHETSLSGPR